MRVLLIEDLRWSFLSVRRTLFYRKMFNFTLLVAAFAPTPSGAPSLFGYAAAFSLQDCVVPTRPRREKKFKKLAMEFRVPANRF